MVNASVQVVPDKTSTVFLKPVNPFVPKKQTSSYGGGQSGSAGGGGRSVIDYPSGSKGGGTSTLPPILQPPKEIFIPPKTTEPKSYLPPKEENVYESPLIKKKTPEQTYADTRWEKYTEQIGKQTGAKTETQLKGENKLINYFYKPVYADGVQTGYVDVAQKKSVMFPMQEFPSEIFPFEVKATEKPSQSNFRLTNLFNTRTPNIPILLNIKQDKAKSGIIEKQFYKSYMIARPYLFAPLRESKKFIQDIGGGILSVEKKLGLPPSILGIKTPKASSVFGIGDIRKESNISVSDINRLGNLVQASAEFIPTDELSLSLTYAGVKGYQYVPKITSTIFGGLSLYSISKATTSKEATAGALGFGASALGFGGSKTLQDYLRTRGMEKITLAEYKTKPFLRSEEYVFMKRFEGLKLTEPKTILYKLKGYKKGQFIERQYRLISPEVQARYEGKTEVEAYFLRDNKPVLQKIKTTPFPYSSQKSQLKYFKELNIKEFKIPKKIKGIDFKAFGFSATGKEWMTTEIGETGSYYSGKGISIRFLRIGGKEKIPINELNLFGLRESSSPTVYAGYFKEARINKALREIKIPNIYEPKGKPVKKYIFSEPTGEGILNLPVYKKEVEGVVFGETIPLREQFYFKLSGRRVTLKEQTFKTSLTEKELLKLSKGGELKTERQRPSSLPSGKRSSGIFQTYNLYYGTSSSKSKIPSGSKPSYKKDSYKTDYSKSSLSKFDIPSSYTGKSYSSSFFKSSTIPYEPPYSPPYEPPYRRPPKKTPPDYPYYKKFLLGKERTQKLKKGSDEYFISSSFTARVLGIKTVIKEKDLLKEASKFRSGLELRGIPVIK